MNLDLLSLLRCPCCQHDGLAAHVLAEKKPGVVDEGFLSCGSCREWFVIHDRILELVPPALADADLRAAFAKRHAHLLADRIATPRTGSEADYGAQREQQEYFDWYAANEEFTYDDYAALPFWIATTGITMREWRERLAGARIILEPGCADGRCTEYLYGLDAEIVGFDISRAMIRRAIRRHDEKGGSTRGTYLVADGNHFPFRDSAFDHIVMYGVLHHLPDPGRTVRECVRVLKEGGTCLNSENNKSAFRRIFDWTMKLLPLWQEKAGAEPLLGTSMYRAWIDGEPASIELKTSVFLPPHLLNLFGTGGAEAVLRATNAACRILPWLRWQGGLIQARIVKRSDRA